MKKLREFLTIELKEFYRKRNRLNNLLEKLKKKKELSHKEIFIDCSMVG